MTTREVRSLLEPCAGQAASTGLRGGRGSNASPLPEVRHGSPSGGLRLSVHVSTEAITERTAMSSVADVPSDAVKLIEIDQGQLRQHVDGLVRNAVEETLNALLDAEADQLCGAHKYERSPDRVDYRAGSYQRRFHTKAGEVELKVPKLRRATFESQVIERYRRRETSVEEALVEMYLAGVSVRRVEDITEALWGTRVSPSTVSELNQKIYARIHE